MKRLKIILIAELKPEDCERWAAKYVKQSSPTNFNNSID